MRKLILILLFPALTAVSQNQISLDDCYKWARDNYPNVRQSGIMKEITALKKENLKTNWLPQVNLTGQATYQSDVPGIQIPFPGISIPTVPKDQYKAYFEFRQNIWEGGMTKTSAMLEESLLENNLNQLEVELYRLNEQVLQTFFTAVTVSGQIKVMNSQKEVLLENLKSLEAGIKNGVIEESAPHAIEAEILVLEQNVAQLIAAENTSYQVLSLLTGKNIQNGSLLIYTYPIMDQKQELIRPEMQLFTSQNAILNAQSEMLVRSRYPKVYGFGQAGFGKPGLNMLNDKFDSFYLVGVGISWNAFDWKKTSRQQQILGLQSETVKSQEETFARNIKLLLAQQQEQITKLETMAEKDIQIVELRNNIIKAAESKLKFGTLTSSEYIREVQGGTVARLNLEMHKIQLIEAKEKYNIIHGKWYGHE